MVLKRMAAARRQPPSTPEKMVTEVARLQRSGAAQIVDVREPHEWAGGCIPTAIPIPLGALLRRMNELDRAQPVITVCRSGHRSLAAADALIDAGFTDVASLRGGMQAWMSANEPVVS